MRAKPYFRYDSILFHLRSFLIAQIWDRSDRRLSAFIRLNVADILHPTPRRYTIGDIVCFTNPIGNAAHQLWKSDGTSMTLIDRDGSGAAVAVTVGHSIIFSSSNSVASNTSTTRADIDIYAPDAIAFENVSTTFVTNGDAQQFVFPIVIHRHANNTSTTGNVYGNVFYDFTFF